MLQSIEDLLRMIVPADYYDQLKPFANLICGLESRTLTAQQASALIAANPRLTAMLQNLPGKQAQHSGSTLSFGSDNMFGDVSIGHVAGGDIFQFTITLPDHSPRPTIEAASAQIHRQDFSAALITLASLDEPRKNYYVAAAMLRGQAPGERMLDDLERITDLLEEVCREEQRWVEPFLLLAWVKDDFARAKLYYKQYAPTSSELLAQAARIGADRDTLDRIGRLVPLIRPWLAQQRL